jgi:hypothetical protein
MLCDVEDLMLMMTMVMDMIMVMLLASVFLAQHRVMLGSAA